MTHQPTIPVVFFCLLVCILFKLLLINIISLYTRGQPRTDTGETMFGALKTDDLTRGHGLIRKGCEDGINLARMMAPSVADVLNASASKLATAKAAEEVLPAKTFGADPAFEGFAVKATNEGLADYATKFAEAGVRDVNLAAFKRNVARCSTF